MIANLILVLSVNCQINRIILIIVIVGKKPIDAGFFYLTEEIESSYKALKLCDRKSNEVVKNTKFSTLKNKVKKLHKKISAVTILIHINQQNTEKQNLEK